MNRIKKVYEDSRNIRETSYDYIRQGFLFEIFTDCFFTSGKEEKTQRPTKLFKGEIIEIRFPYAWHFRTIDNIYYHATSEMIKDNCLYFGEIWENVRSGNKATLSDILRLQLYKGENHYKWIERIKSYNNIPEKIMEKIINE